MLGLTNVLQMHILQFLLVTLPQCSEFLCRTSNPDNWNYDITLTDSETNNLTLIINEDGTIDKLASCTTAARKHVRLL